MGDDYWQPTAEMFSSLFEKPKMTEKLLTKPPFKYLFDIIVQTSNTTGFGDGLYSEPELQSEFYDVKEKKMYFLQKCIALVSIMIKEEIEAKPNKIVAGVEPEKTNLFLQALYRAAVSMSGISKEDSDRYIRKVLTKFGKEEVEIVGREPPQDEPPKSKPQVDERKPDKKPEPKSQAGSSKNVEPEKPKEPLVRPPSANKRTKDKPSSEIRQQPSAPTGIMREENKQDEDDFIEKPSQNQTNMSKIDAGGHHGKLVLEAQKDLQENRERDEAEPKETGGIKMKKRVGAAKGTPATQTDKGDTSAKGVATATSLTGAGSSQNEVETIQKLIQSLTQNINPLRKSIDFINDDIESMNKEMDHWRSQYLGHKAKYQLELATTEEQLQPLQNKLAELEEQIKDRRFKIQAAKAQVLQNDQKIQKLLFTVVSNK